MLGPLLVCLEDTCNKGGGSIWDISEIKEVSKVARELGLIYTSRWSKIVEFYCRPGYK